MTPVLGPTDIAHFRSAVTCHLGLQYEDGKLDYLADVMRQRMQSVGRARFESYSAYLGYLNGSPKGSYEWRALAEQLTVPIVVHDHADRAAHMALDMLIAIQDFNASSQYPLNIRIGISSGAAVAGIIGKSKFLYDLWGDVVNTASRMESHGTPGRIQMSDSTRQALTQPFSLEDGGVIDVKGKGEMSTWFLNNRALN